MLKRLFIIATLFLLTSITAFADDVNDVDYGDDVPAMLAQKAHSKSMSDVIYQQEDFRALYYQNQQIILLLKELRDAQRETLLAIREQAVKDDKA